MATLVLIATPTNAFGELIRLTLEGEGNYRATRVSTGCDALSILQSTPFALAILDADLHDLPLPDLFSAIQKLRPGIRLILVPPHNDSGQQDLSNLPCDGFLSKPFYLPDLIAIVEHALRGLEFPQPARSISSLEKPSARETEAPQQRDVLALDSLAFQHPPARPILPVIPAWLQDATRAAQHLTRLTLETAAMATLIIREDHLWAYAGQHAQPAAQELAELVSHYWRRGNGTDLARFVHLNATGEDILLYATALNGELTLAMAFELSMPFSKIRAQASILARSLAGAAEIGPAVAVPTAGPAVAVPTAGLAMAVPAVTGAWPAATSSRREAAPSRSPLDPFFEAAPSAVPYSTPSEPWQAIPAGVDPSPDSRPASANAEQAPRPKAVPSALPLDALPRLFEPVYPVMCNLSYACILVPRMPQHVLKGDLAERLKSWTHQLCLAYGWRLEKMVLEPMFIEWVIQVPPHSSPGMVMNAFRQQSSARIFTDFPSLGRDNPSGDFWAPGYLILTSGQEPSDALVKDFIQQTRHRQGVS